MSAVDEIAEYLAYLKTGGNRIDQIIFDEIPNGEEMTATDELRRLLDERGVEHMDFNMPDKFLTMFGGGEHDGAYTENSVDTILTVYGASPEQAVEATLGRGTCKLVPTRDKPRSKAPTLTCSECGWWTDEIGKAWHYCPNCGRKVVGA